MGVRIGALCSAMVMTVACTAPQEYRANDVLSNIDTFYAATDVKPGDRMYRGPALV